jgi:hypothetical protein
MLTFQLPIKSEMQVYQRLTGGLPIALLAVIWLMELHMTIRIEREAHHLKTMIRVSGRLQSKYLEALKTQLEGPQSRIALDLNGVTLVDVETVRFLNACEKGGVEILHCWPYIQEWMRREKDRENESTEF